MKFLMIPFNILYRLYFGIVFFGVLIILYPLFWFLLLNDKKFNSAFKLKVFTAKVILFFQGIFYKIKSKSKKINEDEQYIICMNHSSYLDIILMYPIFKKQRFLFIGKSELLKWPVINIFFKRIDIAIDRNKKIAASKALQRAKDKLSEGWSIAIYPEGTIPISTPKLDNFKNGAFKIAIQTQKPILPVTFIDNWRLFRAEPMITSNARPGRTRVIIHDPIPTEGLTEKDLVYLRNKTFEVINKPLLDYHKKVIEKIENGNK